MAQVHADFLEEGIHEPNGVCNGALVPSCSKDALEETESDEEEIERMFSKTQCVVPSRSQVLYYLSSSSSFRIVRSGSDLQVTDRCGFPLLDVWPERTCCTEIWIVETYASPVLMLADRNSSGWHPFRRTSPPIQTATDWNGDTIGQLIPGNPFLIQNSNRTTIARCLALDNGEQRDCWSCVLEASGREAARLDPGGQLSFTCEVGFQLKLLIVTALARTRATPATQPLCWPFGSK